MKSAGTLAVTVGIGILVFGAGAASGDANKSATQVQALVARIDSGALSSLQGEWIVEEWTGYKPLAMYEGYMAVSKDNDYSGSRLTVDGTNTTWELRITDNMKGLLLGLFSAGKDLTVKKEGATTFYVDKAAIVDIQDGAPGRVCFGAASAEGGKVDQYAGIWELKENRLVICKAKVQGAKCADTLDIPADDFFNTRMALRRSEKAQPPHDLQ